MTTTAQRIQNLKRLEKQAVAKLDNAISHNFSPSTIRMLRNHLCVATSNVAMAQAFEKLERI